MELVMPDGEEASVDVPRLREAYARRLLRMVIRAAPRAYVAQRLVELTRSAPELGAELLLEPMTSVAIETGDLRAALAAVAFSLAELGRLGERRVELAPLTTAWSIESDTLVRAQSSLALADGTVWIDGEPHALSGCLDSPAITHPFPVIEGRIRFALFDANPHALDETHPEKDGNALSLGGRSAADWLSQLRVAFALVQAHLPSVAAEMRSMLRLVIPVGASDERHLSASYREYVGAVYLSLHRDPVTMAEALVHEFQHNKLNLLSWHYPVLENGYDFLYRSPVRPDPRPLMGILLAAHAFVPVAEFHRRLLAAAPAGIDLPSVERRFRDVVARNAEALAVLTEHGRPATAGALVLERLGALHESHRGRFGDLSADLSHVA